MKILASEYTNNLNGREPSIDCSCDAPTNYLLPCKHTFALAVQEHGAFPLSLINNLWILSLPPTRLPEQIADHDISLPVFLEVESNRSLLNIR